MRVVILGGGVVGVTTAYQAQRDGHEVVIVERHDRVCAGASWGNAGMIAPGHAFTWSSPAAPKILLKSMLVRNQALRFKLSTDPYLYTWSWAFLKECTEEKAQRNTLLKHRLAAYSQRVLHQVTVEETITYDRNHRGIVYLHRTQETLDRGAARMRLLESGGQMARVVDADTVIALDPSLASAKEKIAGAIYCPTDETGDPAKFTRALARKVVERGGDIRTCTTVTRIENVGRDMVAVHTDKGIVKGDVYVLALGSNSAIVARSFRLTLPIYPVKGYSLTIPIEDHPRPPTLGVLDEDRFVAVSNLGDRVRVTATAEFAGHDTHHRPSDFNEMKRVAQELYPDGANYEHGEMWAGLRPMTPSNLPILGRKYFRNLFINTGHGHLGWTMSHGSARITADLIAGRIPAIPINGLVDA
jgi:D-amino-acid dehydrogenase